MPSNTRHRLILLALGALLWAGSAQAQAPTITAVTDAITANADFVILQNIGGYASARIQVTGTYDDTWEVQCSSRGTPQTGYTFDADDELSMVKQGTTTTVAEVTDDAEAIWQVPDITGCLAIRVIATAFTSGTQTITIVATTAGGGGGSAGGSPGSSDTTEATQLLVLGAVDGLEALLGTTNTSLAIIDNVVFGAGTEAAAQRVTIANNSTGVVGTIEAAGALLTAAQLIDNIVRVEDDVAGSAFSGVGFLAVRQDSQSDLCADGDFCPITVDADGNLRVTTAAGSGTSLADDGDIVAGTTAGTPAIGFYQSTVTACTDGDACIVGITSGRAAKVHFTDAAGASMAVDTQALWGGAVTFTAGTVPTGGFSFGRVSAAAPSTTGVIDDDAVVPWMLGTGAGVAQPSFAGVLAVAGAGGTGTGVQRVIEANDSQLSADVALIKTAVQLIDNQETAATGFSYTSVAASESEHAVTANPATLWSVTATNHAATIAFLRCENDNAAGTAPGTDTPELDLAIPGATTGAGITFSFPRGVAFSTAITCWVVTGEAQSDVAEVGADDVKLLYSFKP